MTCGSTGTLEEPHLYSFFLFCFVLHGMVSMELVPELSIRAKVLWWSQKEPPWWPVLRHKGDIPELALQLLLVQSVPLTRTNLQILIIKLRPYKALAQFILKERRGSTPTQDKDESSQPKEILLHKKWGEGRKEMERLGRGER